MVTSIRNIELALIGSGLKEPSISEKKNVTVARKSIHLNNNINKGCMLTRKDLIMKRPGDGISPMEIDNVINCIAKIDLAKGHKLTYQDFIR